LKNRYFLLITLSVALVAFVTAKDEPTVELTKKAISLDFYDGTLSWFEFSKPISEQATLVGIHGTPGGWSAWSDIGEQTGISPYRLIAIDRPGWGQSLNKTDDVIPNLNDQADIIAMALEDEKLSRPVILIAHSWGGPVALNLAARHGELVDGLVLLASPADPVWMQPRWYHKAAKWKVVQLVIGKSMTRSNVEMLALEDELKKLQSKLSSITQPTIIMQGKKDFLVAPENAFYLQKELSNAQVKLMYDMKGNHFIPFNKPEEVITSINWVYQQTLTQQAGNL